MSLDAIDALRNRYRELERARDAVQNLILDMDDIDLPDGIEGSHHASMEWDETLEMIETEMQNIEDAISLV